MSRPELVVPLADLERGPKRVEFALSEAWLRGALEGTDASVAAAPGKLDLTLTKNGPEVLARGTLTAELTMPCVVTLDPVPVAVKTEIVLMLAPKRPGTEAPAERGAGRRARVAAAKGQTGTGHWEETPLLTDEDAGRDTYEGHEIVLDHFVREFLILELPMFPRRSDLPTDGPAANPPLPAGNQPEGQAPLDPRLSPLAELKSRLEKLKKE